MADELKMDVREKLVEFLHDAHNKVAGVALEDDDKTYSDAVGMEADELIANGVTVQDWVSVDDRLPDKPMRCLVYTKRGGYCGYDITYYNQGFYSEYSKVTHWMPLPEPPKELAR